MPIERAEHAHLNLCICLNIITHSHSCNGPNKLHKAPFQFITYSQSKSLEEKSLLYNWKNIVEHGESNAGT